MPAPLQEWIAHALISNGGVRDRGNAGRPCGPAGNKSCRDRTDGRTDDTQLAARNTPGAEPGNKPLMAQLRMPAVVVAGGFVGSAARFGSGLPGRPHGPCWR